MKWPWWLSWLCLGIASAILVAACGGSAAASRQHVVDMLHVLVSAVEDDSITCVLDALEETGSLQSAGPAMEKAMAGEDLTDTDRVAGFAFQLALERCVSKEEFARSDPSPLRPGSEPGDSELLDTLWTECADGEFSSCDLLFHLADPDSEYERFAADCGDRTQTTGYCVDVFGAPLDLSSYRSSCDLGDMKACDLLFFRSPPGSADNRAGATCGGRNEQGPLRCVQIHGYPPSDGSA